MANKWDERKKAQEDEYFLKKEREQLAKLKAKQETESKSRRAESLLYEVSQVRRAAERAQLPEDCDRSMHQLPGYLARCRRVGAGGGEGKRRLARKILAEKRLMSELN